MNKSRPTPALSRPSPQPKALLEALTHRTPKPPLSIPSTTRCPTASGDLIGRLYDGAVIGEVAVTRRQSWEEWHAVCGRKGIQVNWRVLFDVVFFLFGWWIQGWRLDLYAVQRHLEQNSGWLSEGLSIERRHRKLVFSVTLDDISIYFNFQPPIDEEFLQSMFVGVV